MIYEFINNTSTTYVFIYMYHNSVYIRHVHYLNRQNFLNNEGMKPFKYRYVFKQLLFYHGFPDIEL